ncbi:MAG: hypothetical protein FJW26_03215 [Acidimicrobiia bacterium]|nr:hypothetical protein [Acidimicrobiia bacterium]
MLKLISDNAAEVEEKMLFKQWSGFLSILRSGNSMFRNALESSSLLLCSALNDSASSHNERPLCVLITFGDSLDRLGPLAFCRSTSEFKWFRIKPEDLNDPQQIWKIEIALKQVMYPAIVVMTSTRMSHEERAFGKTIFQSLETSSSQIQEGINAMKFLMVETILDHSTNYVSISPWKWPYPPQANALNRLYGFLQVILGKGGAKNA